MVERDADFLDNLRWKTRKASGDWKSCHVRLVESDLRVKVDGKFKRTEKFKAEVKRVEKICYNQGQ